MTLSFYIDIYISIAGQLVDGTAVVSTLAINSFTVKNSSVLWILFCHNTETFRVQWTQTLFYSVNIDRQNFSVIGSYV